MTEKRMVTRHRGDSQCCLYYTIEYSIRKIPTPPPPFCFTSPLMTYLHQHFFGAFALIIGKGPRPWKVYNPFQN